MKKMSYRLGLDVGANSLGWSVLALENGEPRKVAAAGARIFSDGRDVKSKATLKASRTAARSARRNRDRFLQRQRRLLIELQKAGLFPASENERKKLQGANPLELRARAIKEKLIPYEIGRALFHINQRRGFLSNRKDQSKDARDGVVAKSYDKLLERMGLLASRNNEEKPDLSREEKAMLSKEEKKKIKEQNKLARQMELEGRAKALDKLREDAALSYGAFLWQQQRKREPTRARRGADGYDVYPMRALYEDEFDKIWQKQKTYHPDILVDDARKGVHSAIFFQRPLKPQKRGQCAYLPNKIRAFRAMPSFQLFRVYQEVNNLSWITSAGGRWLRDEREARERVVALLKKPATKGREVSWAQIKKQIKELGLAEGDIRFNFETAKRDKGLECDLTARLMRDENCVGAQWDEWKLEKQDEFINAIFESVRVKEGSDEMREQTDDEVCARLQKDFGLSENAAKACLSAHFPEGAAALSVEAARLLADKMKTDFCQLDKAVAAVAEENKGFVNPYGGGKGGGDKSRLPYYGEAFFSGGKHIIRGDRNKEDEGDDLKYHGGVTNPTVHIALNQIRLVVNELIARYGAPASVAIELGRDLPAGEEGRKELEKEQRENQKLNDKRDEKLRELGQRPNRANRLRLALWEELGKTPTDRCCPFTGRLIGVADLFNEDAGVEVEHLLPFGRTLDDSRANKVLSSRQANRDKGDRSPFEAFGNSPPGYNWNDICERAAKLPRPKQWRFLENAMEIWNKGDGDDFSERHLNDTRYIGRLAKEYLELVCPANKIDVLPGRLTALLRKEWGLNSILPGADDKTKKNRDDHRHHAVDAVVIGMTSRSMLQKAATAANRSQGELRDVEGRIFARDENGNSRIDPWGGFREEVRRVAARVVVSHKIKSAKPRYKKTKNGKMVRVSTDGQLHNDTAYGLIEKEGETQSGGARRVVSRKAISWFDKRERLLKIRDRHLRSAFLSAFESGGKKDVEDFAQKRKIRSLRCEEILTVIPIKDKRGRVYKAYKGDSNWGVEIYEYPQGQKQVGRWHGAVISQFDAHRPDFVPGRTCRPHPAARLVMRLRANDCVMLEPKPGEGRIMRLHKFSQIGQLNFSLLHEANVDARERDSADTFSYFRKNIGQLKKLKARKVCVSAAGRWSFEKPRKK